MHTFYKGNGLKDIIISNYIDGTYLNKETGRTVELSNKLTKLNIKIVAEINQLNISFYKLIIAESVSIKLLKENSNYNDKELTNVYRIMKSQSGTIRFNRMLKMAVKSYGIDYSDIRRSIRKDLDKQYERVKHNEKILLMLLEDYGLKSVIELIENESGTSFLESVYNYFNDKQIDISNEESLSETEHYSKLTEMYVEYVKGLVSKNGMSLDNKLSDDLLAHRSKVEEETTESSLIRKESNKKSKLFDANSRLKRDNSSIIHDVNASWYDKLYKIDRDLASKLFNLAKSHTGKLWYVALSSTRKNSNIHYINSKFKKVKTLDLAEIFHDKREAVEFYNKVLSGNNVNTKDTTVALQEIKLNSKAIEDINKSKIDNSIELLNRNDLNVKEISIVRKILNTSNGIYNYSPTGKVNVIKVKNINLKDKYYGTTYYAIVEDDGAVEITKDLATATMFKDVDTKVTNAVYVLECKYNNNYEVTVEEINLHSKWYENKINKLNREYEIMLGLIYEDSNVEIKESDLSVYLGSNNKSRYESKLLNRFIWMLNMEKLSGNKEVYFIMEISGKNDTSTFVKDNSNGVPKLVTSLYNIEKIVTRAELQELYNKCLKSYGPERIFMIKAIDLTKIKHMDRYRFNNN